MHKSLLLSVLLFSVLTAIFLFSPQQVLAIESATSKIATINKNQVYTRNGPGTNFKIIDKFPLGTQLEVLEKGWDREGKLWYKVRLPGNRQGWLAGWLVKISTLEKELVRSSPARSVRKNALVIGNGVNIRSQPSLKSKVVAQANKGTELVVINQSQEWYRVQLADYKTGWIHTSLVSIKSFLSRRTASRGYSLDRYLQGRVIVLDPGHANLLPTGPNPGAIGPGKTREADVVLEISQKAAAILTNLGATVIITREGTSTCLSLDERAALANRLGADIFVSIHANANHNPQITGSSVYFYAPWSNSVLAAQREKRVKLAQSIQEQLVHSAGTIDLGIMENGFKVLRATSMPSVLVETAFLSNPWEEKLLSTAAFRQKLSWGIARGIKSYLYGTK